MRFMFYLTGIWNVRLGSALDVDLKITWLQNVPSHQKIIRNVEGKYVLMKKVIVHATTAKITMNIRHACHRCVYLMVIVIFAVVACTIPFFVKTYLLSPFFNYLLVAWEILQPCDLQIHI